MNAHFQLSPDQLAFLVKLGTAKEGERADTERNWDSPLTGRVRRGWALLGDQMGFDPDTVDGIPGFDEHHFTAEEVPRE